MSSLFRRSNGTWYVVYRERNRRKWLSTGERCFGRARRFFQTCPSDTDQRRPKTISGFLGELIEYASTDHSKGTIYLYSHRLRNLIKCVGDKPMRFVTGMDVDRFKTERAKNLSPVSVNGELRTLKTVFNIAVNWGVITNNVFAKAKQMKVPFKEPAYLTRKEFDSLLSLIGDEEFRFLLMFAVSTMMRRAEIVNLEWADIDFERKLIHVRNKDDSTLKGLRPRVIPMSKKIFTILFKKKRDGGFVFMTPSSHKLNGQSISQKFKRCTRKCKLPEAIHFHSLRHSGATWRIQEGVPLYFVQKLLGHTTAEMTEVYSHLSDDNLRNAIEQIDIALN